MVSVDEKFRLFLSWAWLISAALAVMSLMAGAVAGHYRHPTVFAMYTVLMAYSLAFFGAFLYELRSTLKEHQADTDRRETRRLLTAMVREARKRDAQESLAASGRLDESIKELRQVANQLEEILREALRTQDSPPRPAEPDEPEHGGETEQLKTEPEKEPTSSGGDHEPS